MAINRFYSPQRSQYISQFVPNQLPTDLMMGMLANKQKQEDDKQATLAQDRLFDWEIVPGAMQDKKDKEAILGELYSKIDEFSTKDITTDPAAWQEYKTFTRNLQNNEKIKAMKAYRAQYDSYQENRAKIIQDPNKYGGGEALYKQDREWDRYTTGEGYLGKGYQGLTEARERFDIDKELRETYKAIKADSSSWENLGELVKTGGSLKEIAASGKIQDATLRHFESWRQGPVGKAIEDIIDQQLGLDYTKKAAILSDPEASKQYEAMVNNALYERAMAVGQDYTLRETTQKISDRSEGAIKRNQDAKALVLAMGMGTTTFDPEAVLENFDAATNNTNAVLKELDKLGVTSPTNLFTSNGAVDQKVYTKLMTDIDTQLTSGKLSPEAKQDLADRKKALEENVYTINTVSNNLELGKYKERAGKDAAKNLSARYGVEQSTIEKYLTPNGFDFSPLLNIPPSDIPKLVASGKISENDLKLIASLNKTYKRDNFISALFKGNEFSGLEVANGYYQNSTEEWYNNWKHNKGQEPPTDRIDYGVSTEDTKEMVKLVKEGVTISVVDPVSGKPFTINSKNFPNLNITVSDEVGPNGKLLNIVTTTADDKGTYFDPNKGEMVTDAARANQTIKHSVYMKDESSLTAMTSSTPDKLISAAQSKLSQGNVEEATMLLNMALSEQAAVRGVEGATNLGTYTNHVNFSIEKGETQDIPAIKLNVNNTVYNMTGLQVKSVESPTGRISLTLLKNGQPIVTNISNPKSLGHEIEKVAQQEEMRMQTSSGGNLSPY